MKKITALRTAAIVGVLLAIGKLSEHKTLPPGYSIACDGKGKYCLRDYTVVPRGVLLNGYIFVHGSRQACINQAWRFHDAEVCAPNYVGKPEDWNKCN